MARMGQGMPEIRRRAVYTDPNNNPYQRRAPALYSPYHDGGGYTPGTGRVTVNPVTVNPVTVNPTYAQRLAGMRERLGYQTAAHESSALNRLSPGLNEPAVPEYQALREAVRGTARDQFLETFRLRSDIADRMEASDYRRRAEIRDMARLALDSALAGRRFDLEVEGMAQQERLTREGWQWQAGQGAEERKAREAESRKAREFAEQQAVDERAFRAAEDEKGRTFTREEAEKGRTYDAQTEQAKQARLDAKARGELGPYFRAFLSDEQRARFEDPLGGGELAKTWDSTIERLATSDEYRNATDREIAKAAAHIVGLTAAPAGTMPVNPPASAQTPPASAYPPNYPPGVRQPEGWQFGQDDKGNWWLIGPSGESYRVGGGG